MNKRPTGMNRRRSDGRRVGTVVLASAVVLVLAGCSHDDPPAATVSHHLGMAPGLTTNGQLGSTTAAAAGWGDPGQLLIMTEGSSGCPALPDVVTAPDTHTVVVTTRVWVPPPNDACSADLAPTTATVAIPSTIDDAAPVTVRIDSTEVHLAPRR